MKKVFTILFISIFLSSCETNSEKIETVSLVVVAKDKTWNDGTEYRIAFEDGTDYAVSFGVYSNYDIGDTVIMQGYPSESKYYWEIIDKK